MKSRKAYKILTACSVLFPINRYYLGRSQGLFGRTITLNYLTFGWYGDLFYMDKTFDEAMMKRGFTNSTIRNSLKR